NPGGVLVEIMNEDGSMARLPDLFEISKKFSIKIVAIRDLIRYRLGIESIVEKGEQVKLPTEFGDFEFIPFRQLSNGLEHAALVKGTWTKDDTVLVRVHSSCFTGDIFGSKRCDCGPQLHKAMQMVEEAGKGAIVYLNQEGRGIGLINKIKTYKLQEQGRDTVEANIELGFREDERDYGIGASIMREIGLGKVRLISNNPVKRAGLEGYGISIVDAIPLIIEPNRYNSFYLETKASKMGHSLVTYRTPKKGEDD
ncbi:MAG TPA: GTP cyclohydrolase II, partial [Bacteroidales bacterium]|nr:GTP cyclohydrolase II [Bacteroidales bacterium]